MFDFDFDLLDDPGFKEDSVREEVVVPLIRRLGYSASGDHKIARSKTLLHPYVMIGSKRHPVNIIPDYVLYAEGRPAFVLDAKGPDCKLIKSKHAEQAYSYAIHPDVRTRFYALCNGRSLVAYDIYGISPVFEIPIEEIDEKWNVIASVLSPANTGMSARRRFAPDFGTALLKMGVSLDTRWHFPFAKFEQVGQVGDNFYCLSASFEIGGISHLATFDCDRKTLDTLLSAAAASTRDAVFEHLIPGQQVFTKEPLHARISTNFGLPTQGEDEKFVPLVIHDVIPMTRQTYDEMVAEAFGDS